MNSSFKKYLINEHDTFFISDECPELEEDPKNEFVKVSLIIIYINRICEIHWQ